MATEPVTLPEFPGDHQPFRELVTHLLARGNAKTMLYPERLPPQLPFTSVCPTSFRVIGSRLDLHGPFQNTQILIEYRESLEAAFKELRQHFTNTDWLIEADPFGISAGGFFPPQDEVAVGQANVLHLRHLPSGTTVLIHQHAESEAGNVFIVHVRGGEIAPNPEELYEQRLQPMPSLIGPADSVQVTGGMSTGETVSTANALFQTDLSLEALLAHFAAQLETQGWKKVDEIANLTILVGVWSRQTFGRAVRATLCLHTVADRSGHGRAMLHATISISDWFGVPTA
jgi:hypothetical protein